MIHLLVDQTQTTACGEDWAHRSWALDVPKVTCRRCLAAARAWRKEAARGLRVTLMQNPALFPPHVRDALLAGLLAAIAGVGA